MFLYSLLKSTEVIELHNRTYAEEYIYISYPYLNAFFIIYSEITLLSVRVHAHSCCSAIPEE